MVNLIHEIWEDHDDSGEPLPGCCLAGADGDGFRGMLGAGARLVHTFQAGSHYEAMKIYNRFLGWPDYVTDQPSDMAPYPPEWLVRQTVGFHQT